MADIGKLTIGVSLSVDEKTAQACLKIIEMYVNQTGADIIGHKEDDGSIAYHFEYGFDAQKLGIEPKEKHPKRIKYQVCGNDYCELE